MSTDPTSGAKTASGRREWALLCGAGLLALAPYAANLGKINRLYWFGDEFDLIDQIDRLGFWHWVWRAFAENFVPLFKVLWGGAVLGFGGSYPAMIAVVWLTHALNVALLGRVMRGCGLGWGAVLLAMAAFGLTPGNMETLCWSVQWSAMLAITFMLAGLDAALRARQGPGAYAAWSGASALAFSRGVLTGPVIAFVVLCRKQLPLRSRAWQAALILAPSAAVAVLIAVLVPTGNQSHMAGHWGEAACFSAWYYGLNPAYRLFGVESWGPRTVSLLLAAKLALVAWALWRSKGLARVLFAALVLSDLGNALLLGIGRYHTGLSAAASSRYQYASLIGIAPLAGFWLSAQWSRLPLRPFARNLALAAVIGAAAISMIRGWRGDLEGFVTWRGTQSRDIFITGTSRADEVPGFPGFPMERAKAIVRKYGLH